MLRLEQVSMSVNQNNGDNKEILHNIDLEFDAGKLYAITGPNGGGKTSSQSDYGYLWFIFGKNLPE